MSSATPPGRQRPGIHPDTVIEKYKRRTTVITSVAAVVVAILGVTAAITSTKANNSSNRADTLSILVSNVQQSAQSAAVAQTSDQGELASARAQLSQEKVAASSLASVASSQADALSNNPAGSTTTMTVTTTERAAGLDTAGPTASPAAPAAPTKRHAGTIRIANNNSVDLDAPAEDNLWATGDNMSDISYYQKKVEINNNSIHQLSLGSTKATYATCDTTGYSGDPIDLSESPAGTNICVETSGHRFAAIRVISASDSVVVLDVVTFDPPFASS